MDDLQKFATIFSKAQVALSHVTTEGGEVTVLGRPVKYQWEGYMYNWELHFKARVEDVWSGLEGEARDYLNRFRSFQYALLALLQQLLEEGYLKNISPEYLEPLSRAVADSVEDPSNCSRLEQLQEEILSNKGEHKERDTVADQATTSVVPSHEVKPSSPPVPSAVAQVPCATSSSPGQPMASQVHQQREIQGSSLVIPDTQAGRVLTQADLPELQRLLIHVAYQTFNIGIQLGLPVGVIQALQKNSSSDAFTFLGLVLAKWLMCKGPPPTLEKLVDVLSGPVINNKALADDVKEHFGSH